MMIYTWPLTSFEMQFFFFCNAKKNLSFMLIQSTVKTGWAKNNEKVELLRSLKSLRESQDVERIILWCHFWRSLAFAEFSESLLSLFWIGFLMMFPKVAERCQRLALKHFKDFPSGFHCFFPDSISFKIFSRISQTFQQASKSSKCR